MNRNSAWKMGLAATFAFGSLAGCASKKQNDELAYVEQPVETIYSAAVESLDRRVWPMAAAQFDEVQRQHPYSIWAPRASLMAAYARYQSRDYDAAIASAQDYITLHPGGESAPYAYYLIAACHFDQIIDVGREQSRTEHALSALNEVISRFPESEYARDAELKRDMVRDQLAGKEMEIGRYYLKRNQHLAAINRFQNVIKTYDTTSHTPEALHRLVEAYVSIGLTGQAKAAAAVLGYNYPGSDWYIESYNLMTGAGIELPNQPVKDESWYKRMWNSIF